jgi:metal-responsive CopG/Arc/MetJ family transcriptional regulator
VKTAVSMPDDLFNQAEATARRLGISRSQLYAKAIEQYLVQRQDSSVTERLNQVYAAETAKLDLGLHSAQLASLKKEVW